MVQYDFDSANADIGEARFVPLHVFELQFFQVHDESWEKSSNSWTKPIFSSTDSKLGHMTVEVETMTIRRAKVRLEFTDFMMVAKERSDLIRAASEIWKVGVTYEHVVALGERLNRLERDRIAAIIQGARTTYHREDPEYSGISGLCKLVGPMIAPEVLEQALGKLVGPVIMSEVLEQAAL